MTIKVINHGEEDGYRTMVRVTDRVEQGAEAGAREGVEMLQKYIRDHWSPSPSSAGNPPAMQTENLDSSILIDDQKRDTSGRFSKDAIVMFLRADTTEGNKPMGRENYAQAVQEKNDRPFIEPAVKAVEASIAQIMKRNIKI